MKEIVLKFKNSNLSYPFIDGLYYALIGEDLKNIDNLLI